MGAADAILCAALGLGTCLLFSGDLGNWWTGDDTQILRHVLSAPPLRDLFDRVAYRGLNERYFFPEIALSFGLDRTLFGLRPTAWYAHQILALSCVVVLLYLVLRRGVGRPAAVLGAGLLAAGPFSPPLVASLWTRHYVEGLLLSLLAALLWISGSAGTGRLRAICVAGLYLAATTAKEVFVPLPLLLVALPVRPFKERLRRGIPLLFAFVLYVVWRQWMLRGYAGAYEAGALRPADVPRRLALVLRELVLSAGGGAPILFAAAVAAGLLALLLRRAGVPRLVWISLLVLGPVVPVARGIEPRYLLVPAAALTAAVAFAADDGVRRGGAVAAGTGAVVLLAAGAMLVAGMCVRRETASQSRRSRAEGLFFYEVSRPGDVLLKPVESAWYFDGLRWMRENVLRRGEPGDVFYDEFRLCGPDRPGERVFTFDAAAGAVTAPPDLVSRIRRAFCGRVRADAPLSAALRYRGTVLSWELGPYPAGAYSLLSGESLARTDCPRKGSLQIVLRGDVPLSIRYESPEGWLAYSPPLVLRVVNGEAALDWSRGSPPDPSEARQFASGPRSGG